MKPDPQMTTNRVRISDLAHKRGLFKRCDPNRLGTVIGWTSPWHSRKNVQVIWDGTKTRQSIATDYLELVND